MGALRLHRSLFPIRRLNVKGRGISRIAVHCSLRGQPLWEEARGPGSIMLPYGFRGELAERQPVVVIPPLPGCLRVSHEAVASRFRGGRGVQCLDGAGQGILEFSGPLAPNRMHLPSGFGWSIFQS